MKFYILLMSLLFCVKSFSQNFEDTWKGYFSYVSVKSITRSDNKIYVATENAIFIYDMQTQGVETFSTIQGLSGEMISTIHYSKDYRTLFIGYENGLIEVVLENTSDILTVVDILDKPTIPPGNKQINQFSEYNGHLYIAAQFGISVYDIENLEFGDTYFIGDLGSQINITQTAIKESYIYAATTTEGVKRAIVKDDNIIDYQQWETITAGNIIGIQNLGEDIYIARSNNNIEKYNGANFTQVANISNGIRDFIVTDNVLTITSAGVIRAYDNNFTLLSELNGLPDYNFVLQTGITFNNTFYLGTQENGMLIVPFNSDIADQILPDGPILNSTFAIDASPGQLWVCFGDVDVHFNPYPLSFRGISNLREEQWTNIEADQLFGASDLVKVTINPLNPEEVYMSSFQKGLLKIEGQEPTILFNQDNSPLAFPPNLPAAEIRIFGTDFDTENNLWMVQSRINDGLIKLSNNGQFQKIDFSNILDGENELALSEVAISREGYVFFGATESGLIGYNPTTEEFRKISEEEGNLVNNNIRSLTFDHSNRLWIGSLQGLRVLFSVGGFFEEGNNVEAQEIIILEDGIPQELLFLQSITDIEVDGSNNKWISTATSGVFYLSPNGQETILRFTKENSPLPSNNIQDIAIDDATGRVYFATVNGLVAYEGTATAPQENLENVYAFPNPVRPGFTGDVTIDGLTARANVKITDIEGNLVFETTSEGGSVLWDTTAFGKYKVASGVYLVLINTEDAIETKVHKIMVIR